MTSGMSRRGRRGHGYCWQNGVRINHNFRGRLRRDERLRGRRGPRHPCPRIRAGRAKIRIQCKKGRDQNRSNRSEIRQDQHGETSSTSLVSVHRKLDRLFPTSNAARGRVIVLTGFIRPRGEGAIVYRIGSPVRIDDRDMFIRFRLFRRASGGVRSGDVRICRRDRSGVNSVRTKCQCCSN
jgi:hypothetical protein